MRNKSGASVQIHTYNNNNTFGNFPQLKALQQFSAQILKPLHIRIVVAFVHTYIHKSL